MLVGPSCEDPCLVTEIEPPAQQAAPFRVPVIVVVDDAGETQHHVAKKSRVLHHVWICCRDGERTQRNDKRKLMSLQAQENRKKGSVTQEGQAREEWSERLEKKASERQREEGKWARPSLILSSMGNGSSGRMLAATRICLESSSTLKTGEKGLNKTSQNLLFNSGSHRTAGWKKKSEPYCSRALTPTHFLQALSFSKYELNNYATSPSPPCYFQIVFYSFSCSVSEIFKLLLCKRTK